MPSPLVMLAAGGTGGHLFPAQALAEELVQRGYRIHLLTDERVRDYGKSFPAEMTHIVPSASISLSDPLRIPQRVLRLARGYLAARTILKSHSPAAVVGFGGYPSLPPVLAACHLGLPTIVHEQNAVLGRANALLASRVSGVATSFEGVVGIPDRAKAQAVLTGNPVRKAVLDVAGAAYPALENNGPFRLVVFGGSQGARFFSDILPKTLKAMQPDIVRRLHVTQQCRSEDLERVGQAYKALGVKADLQPFFSDMPRILSEAHLVICRSGASSIAELGVLGRPAILVPLPHAIDNDQLRNAQSFESAGGGFLRPQAALNPAGLAEFLSQLLGDPETLKEAAKSALRHGRPDAARRLADFVESKMAAPMRASVEKHTQ